MAPAAAKPCKELSVTLAVLAPDNKRQISFSIQRGCENNQAFYILHFVLRDKVGEEFQDRVKLQVTVGDTDSPKAQALMDRGLTMTQIEFLQGPVTTRANKLPSGTTEDKRLTSLVNSIPDVA